MPHWTASLACIAACSGERPSPSASDSTVRTERPSTWASGTRQDVAGSSSTSTVQAPQNPSSHATFVPVRCRRSRSTVDSGVSGGASTARSCPLTVKAITPSPRARESSVGSTWTRYQPGASMPSRGMNSPACARASGPGRRLDRAPAARRRLDRADRDAQAVVALREAGDRDRVVAGLAQRQPGVRGPARHRRGHGGDDRAGRRPQVLQRDLLRARGRRDRHGGVEREQRRHEVGGRERGRRHGAAEGRVGADGRVRGARGRVVQAAQPRLARERRSDLRVRRTRADPDGVAVDRDLRRPGMRSSET